MTPERAASPGISSICRTVVDIFRPGRGSRNSEDTLPSLCSGIDDIPSKLWQSAIHEAGHTVIATMVCRGIIQEVFISDTAVDITVMDDSCDELNTSVQGLTGGVRFHRMQTTVFENGMIAYSGFFAECENLFRNGAELEPLLPQLREQASHDIDRFNALLASEGLSEGEIQSVVIDIGSRLKHYFNSGVWEQILTVAEALLERRRLSGEEVLDLLPAAVSH